MLDSNSNPLTPKVLYEILEKEVAGQTHAKKILAATIFKHLNLQSGKGRIAPKSHVLIQGKTGTGKTLMVETLARSLVTPYISVDATTLTEAGYRGLNVDSIFENLIQQYDGDLRAAESAIVFIDEFDKLKYNTNGDRDIRGLGVQYSLLKILDGDTRTLTIGSSFDSIGAPTVQFRTHDLMFIFAGSFCLTGLSETEIEKTPMRLADHGFLPELIARITTITTTQRLSESDFISSINLDGSNPVFQYQDYLENFGYTLNVSKDASLHLARTAHKGAEGVRNIRRQLDNLLLPLFHDLDFSETGGAINITCAGRKISAHIVNYERPR